MHEVLQLFRSGPIQLPVGYPAERQPRSRGMGKADAGQPATIGAHSPAAIPSDLWEVGPDGTAIAQVGLFRLVVYPNASGGDARFLVLRQPESTQTCRPALLASGRGGDVEAAMLAAARTAARLAGDAASWPRELPPFPQRHRNA